MKKEFILNPQSGKMITKDGKLYKRLVRYGVIKPDHIIAIEKAEKEFKEEFKDEFDEKEDDDDKIEIRETKTKPKKKEIIEEEYENDIPEENPVEILNEDDQIKQQLIIMMCKILHDNKIKLSKQLVIKGVNRYYDLI